MSRPLNLIIALAAAFLGCGLATHATATLITGSINLSGLVQYDTGDLNTAAAITKWGVTKTGVVDGRFGSIAPGTTVTFSSAPWKFNPSTSMSGLWSVGGFTFDLMTSTIVNQGGGSLTLTGSGVVSSIDSSLDANVGTWTFTSTTSLKNSKFTFVAGNGAVPDGGSALALLGIALLGIEALRRKFASA